METIRQLFHQVTNDGHAVHLADNQGKILFFLK